MSEKTVKTHADFILPPSVVSKIQLTRLVSEVERVDDAMSAAAVRKKRGLDEHVQPVMSEQLVDFLTLNKLELDTAPERAALISELRKLKDSVPIIHMTFAVTTDPESLQQIAAWLRSSVHPQAVVAVGLQPDLVAGVYVRTPNHVHDLSLRAALEGRHDLLVSELEALRGV